MPCPAKADFAASLRQAVMNSLGKGYHKKDMDFSRVQASGVSRILMRGESFTAPVTLKRITLVESWLWAQHAESGGMEYLDASCIVFKGTGLKKSESMGHVDFSRLSLFNGAIVHSGDLIDHTKRSGKHTMQIELHLLPMEVKCLYFTMSACTFTPLFRVCVCVCV